MQLREMAFRVGRKIGKRPIASGLFCLSERTLPLHRLGRSAQAVAFCHPRPAYRPHVLVVPTTPFPSLDHPRLRAHKKATLLWEMITLAQKVTKDHGADWRIVVNGGSRQEIGQLHGHLIHDVPEPTKNSVGVANPADHFDGWEYLFRFVEAARDVPGNGYSVTFHLLPDEKVTASFSDQETDESNVITVLYSEARQWRWAGLLLVAGKPVHMVGESRIRQRGPFMKSRTLRMWLKPGMQVKRWLALFVVAMIVVSLGLAMAAAWIYDNFNFPKKLQPYIEWLTLQNIGHPWREILIVGLGGLILAFTLYKLSTSLIAPVLAANTSGRDYADILLEDRFGPSKPELNVVAIGGGTGLSALLRGLKLHDINLTAIVTVADDGGSTGRIRNVFNMPAPGDIRNCLVAMADDESLMGRLFHYRFDQEGSELTGHAFGNLFITALTQVTGSFEQGVTESARVLNVRGRVLPSTLENITLCAEMEDGQVVRGESALAHDSDKIKEVFLEPTAPDAYRPALAAILNADLIVMGPGSLYTSVVPNLLVGGVREAIRWSRAATVYVCNVATQHGETDHMGYEEHINQIVRYLGDGELNYSVVNSHVPGPEAIRPEWQVEPVQYDGKTETSTGVKIVANDVVSDKNPLRHDPVKLANILLDVAREHKATSFPLDYSETA